MGVFEMVVLIVLIATIGEVLKNRNKTKNKMQDLESRLKELGVADQLQRIDQLEDRVRILERIATDKGARISAAIDGL